jgi:hypothetical protein
MRDYSKNLWVTGDVSAKKFLKLMADPEKYEVICCNKNCIHLTNVFVEKDCEESYYRCDLKPTSSVIRCAVSCSDQADKYKMEW